MGQPKIKITKDSQGKRHLMFWCPGCGRVHCVDDTWSFNDDLVLPTIRASILVTYGGSDAGVDGAPPSRCHSFVTDGKVAYCSDSTHELAGQTDLLGRRFPEAQDVVMLPRKSGPKTTRESQASCVT